MPVAACRNVHQCLSRRQEIFNRPTLYQWGEECCSCPEGFARRMNVFKPEPDSHPAPGTRETARRCGECCARIDRRNVSDLCRRCSVRLYGEVR